MLITAALVKEESPIRALYIPSNAEVIINGYVRGKFKGYFKDSLEREIDISQQYQWFTPEYIGIPCILFDTPYKTRSGFKQFVPIPLNSQVLVHLDENTGKVKKLFYLIKSTDEWEELAL